MNGTVFNIQHFTIHDGPGIRTEIFLKGCPMRCQWCSNPESHRSGMEPGVYKTKCIGVSRCGLCLQACPKDAPVVYRNRVISIDREKCIGCMACAVTCPSEAIKPWGRTMTVDDCMDEIRRDISYYASSGGGVTVSGGEPLEQSAFVAELFAKCRAEGIHTCCETTFALPWPRAEQILPVTDLFISDLKHMNSHVHKKYTGSGNGEILQNLKRLTQKKKDLILRIPVIPGVNDDEENIQASADFILNELNGRVRTLQLLSFMRLGEEKYQSLGMPYGMREIKINRKSFQKHVGEIADYFNSRGIHCLVGTREKE